MIHHYFKEISAICRTSYHEEAISHYLIDFAKKHQLYYLVDDLYNVVIFKDGVGDNVVMLQGHVDMVAAKGVNSRHDFLADPIELMITDGYYHANDTTLGADDGVAVAYMLAILSDDTLVHPPLECVFTTQEEVGLVGASHLDLAFSQAKYLIGLDGTNQEELVISSSGGVRATITLPICRQEVAKEVFEITLSGLSGGHSGEMIHLEKGNAIQMMAHLLWQLQQKIPCQLVAINGGQKSNAIADSATVKLAFEQKYLTTAHTVINDFKAAWNIILQEQEKDLTISITPTVSQEATFDLEVSRLLMLLPNGLMHHSLERFDLTLASNNLGIITTYPDKIEIDLSIRSPYLPMMAEIQHKIAALLPHYQATIRYFNAYPGWMIEKDSMLKELALQTYRHLFNKDMKEMAVHGGLELGLLKAKKESLDIIGIGATMYDIHTPKERLNIKSFNETYTFLVTMLQQLVSKTTL